MKKLAAAHLWWTAEGFFPSKSVPQTRQKTDGFLKIRSRQKKPAIFFSLAVLSLAALSRLPCPGCPVIEILSFSVPMPVSLFMNMNMYMCTCEVWSEPNTRYEITESFLNFHYFGTFWGVVAFGYLANREAAVGLAVNRVSMLHFLKPWCWSNLPIITVHKLYLFKK